MIEIAVDTEILLALSKWHNKEEFDKDNLLHDLYDQYGKLLPSKVKAGIGDGERPKLLEDAWLNNISRTPVTGNKMFTHLNDLIILYNEIVAGNIKVYMMPTVENEVKNLDVNKNFIEQYVSAVQFFKDEYDVQKFMFERNLIAQQYAEKGAIEEKFRKGVHEGYISHRARKMAEASRCGLNFIVKRDDIYVHREDGDFARAQQIRQINQNLNLNFVTNSLRRSSAIPQTLRSFIGSLYMSRETKNEKSFYLTNPNVKGHAEAMYFPDGKMDDLKIVKDQYRPIDEPAEGYENYPYVDENDFCEHGV